MGDLWNDGRISAVVNNMDETHAKLLVNLAPSSNHWRGITLEGTRFNRDAIGAR